MKQTIIGPVKKSIRIWLPDEMEKDGGVWVNATVHDVLVNYENIIIEENSNDVDIENTLSSFEDYKIETINETHQSLQAPRG